MAHFYSTVEAKGKSQTKCGTRVSGMSAHIRGWDIGCEVDLRCLDGEDVMHVYLTDGSNGDSRTHIGTWKQTEEGPVLCSGLLKDKE